MGGNVAVLTNNDANDGIPAWSPDGQWVVYVYTVGDDPASADNVAAWEVLSKFDRPFLLCFSDQDAVTKGGDAPFLAKVPGTKGQPHTTIEGGGHFLQEDRGPELARVLIDFIAS